MDDLSGTVHRKYGLLSNMIYLINRDGTIVYKSDWTDHHEVAGMCEDLRRLDDMKSKGIPIIRSSRSERMHWIPMNPELRERVYRRSGKKAIQDYARVNGHLPLRNGCGKKGLIRQTNRLDTINFSSSLRSKFSGTHLAVSPRLLHSGYRGPGCSARAFREIEFRPLVAYILH